MSNILKHCANSKENCDVDRAGMTHYIASGEVVNKRNHGSKTQQDILVDNLHMATQSNYNTISKPDSAVFPNASLKNLIDKLHKANLLSGNKNGSKEHFYVLENNRRSVIGENSENSEKILVVLVLLLLLFFIILF